MTTINVRPYTRRLPEKPRDPFAPVMEARKQAYARKWGVELVGSNDDRMNAHVPDPSNRSRMSMAQIIEKLRWLAKLWEKIGRV